MKVFAIFLVVALTIGSRAFAQFPMDLPSNSEDLLPRTDYVVYSPWGTLPTLYAALHMQLHDKPSFIWHYRDGTLNAEALPYYVTPVGTPGALDGPRLLAGKVSEILTQNPDANFTLYVDDMQAGREFLHILAGNGVRSDSCYVRILSDGSGTYNFYKNLFSGDDGLAAFRRGNDYFNRLYRSSLGGAGPLTTPSSNKMWADLADQMFALSQYPFAELWLTHPELLTVNNAAVGVERMTMRARGVSPQLLFTAMPPDRVSSFYDLIKFDKDLLDQYFAGADKPALVVTGSDPLPENLFLRLAARVAREHGRSYDLYFKPHPNSIPSRAYGEKLLALGFKSILPGRMPMEAILWTYPDLKLGGFQSSLYMAAERGRTLFFIAESGEALPEPLRSLYRAGGFKGVKFYTRALIAAPLPPRVAPLFP